MTKLGDLFDQGLLGEMIREGYVRVQQHPMLPLSIFNYTVEAQYGRAWNAVTTTCRGLIVDSDTGEIVARPFGKFFNYGDPTAGDLDLRTPVIASDKADGSLGILYPVPGGWAVATRGSFTSDQARHATALFNERYAGRWVPPEGVTVLFEIVYPANRIVLDYGELDDLVLLGAIDTDTGVTANALLTADWPGPRVQVFPYASLAEALAAAPRPNSEGLVVRFLHNDQRVKIKQADYLQLHKVLTTCSARRLWEFLAVNACPAPADANRQWYATQLHLDPADAERIRTIGPDWLSTVLDGVPDEFFQWVHARLTELTGAVESLRAEITATCEQMRVQTGGDRKAFAALARPHKHFGAIFRLADGQSIDTYLWRTTCPEHELPFMTLSEDAS
ncbi:RNA ligase [Umezawaea tangerina]|uniref:RNA ligase n=1 Tax=Umezawaea tangerina TaxID=84725 RepID=A0A2T0SPP3_9PSEU|nr:RNA ligase [Umezawaea tangerina]